MLMAVESFGKATVGAVVVEAAGKAVVRHDVGQVVVGQSVDVANAVSGFSPKLFCTVVAVLEDEGSAVDGVVDIVTRAAPVGKVGHVLGDIAASIGAEITDDRIRFRG